MSDRDTLAARGALPAGPTQCPRCKRICDCAEPAERPRSCWVYACSLPQGHVGPHSDPAERPPEPPCPDCGGLGYYATGPTDAPVQTQCERCPRGVPVLQPEPNEAAVEAIKASLQADWRAGLFRNPSPENWDAIARTAVLLVARVAPREAYAPDIGPEFLVVKIPRARLDLSWMSVLAGRSSLSTPSEEV